MAWRSLNEHYFQAPYCTVMQCQSHIALMQKADLDPDDGGCLNVSNVKTGDELNGKTLTLIVTQIYTANQCKVALSRHLYPFLFRWKWSLSR